MEKPTRKELADRIKKADTADLDALYMTTGELVDERLAEPFRPIPEGIYGEIFLRVGFSLHEASKTSNGTNQQVVMEGQVPVRAARDPYASAKPLIDLYCLGFA